MSSIEAKLRRLRGWFIVGFVVQSVVGVTASVLVLDELRDQGLPGLAAGPDPAAVSVASSVPVLAALLALALWVFHELLLRRNWARLVLLAVGWLSAAGAVTSLLSMGGLGMAARCLSGLDLGGLAGIGLVTNALNLLVWGYVIATLQFDRDVRAGFPGVPAGA